MTEKTFPILQGGGQRIPWIVAEKAYFEYAKRHSSQSMERIAERGGFAESEMDEWYPPWRKESDKVVLLLAEGKRMEDEIDTFLREQNEYVAKINALKVALNDLLNDCINFNGGKLTDVFMENAIKELGGYVAAVSGRETPPHGAAITVDDDMKVRTILDRPDDSRET